MNWIRRFIRDERGATAIEYGLIASLIALAIVGAITQYNDRVRNMYNNIASNM